jgi:multidrug resistance efflux pump
MQIPRKHLWTGTVVLIAIIAVLLKYWVYIAKPWTRDATVRAEVVQIAPRVSGPIVTLPIRDNAHVQRGDLLFVIDPRTFQASLDQARAQLDQTGDSVRGLEQQVEAARAAVEVSRADIDRAKTSIAQIDATIEKNEAEYSRQKDLLAQNATSQRSLEWAKASYDVALQEKKGAEAALVQSRAALLQSQASLAEAEAKLGAVGASNAAVRAAVAAVRQAELNLEFTEVRSPVDGYVTNLTLRMGDQAVANQPVLALIDVDSFWIDAYFKETSIGNIRAGDKARVTLMSYPDKPFDARVDSLGWGIAQQNGTAGYELLPNVSPTFEWIRLAQRVPVKILVTNLPEGVALRVGTTASVLVETGSGEQ